MWAERKLGELLKEIPKPKPIRKADGSLDGTIGTLPNGITKKQSHYAQTLADHPVKFFLSIKPISSLHFERSFLFPH